MKRKDKKQFIVLVLLLFVCISIGYAVLNTTLNITGKTSVTKNTWDVHFENIKITEGSVTATVEPAISNDITISNFELTLDKPGDFYEFTVDVVNDGSIDAMIESITKEPELTTEQQKYLNYIIEYQNGEQITTKQLVKSEEFVRLKVRVEFKKDITASDLPQTTEILTLGYNVNYAQSDGTGSSVPGKSIIKIVSGDGTQTSDEVCIGEECFYVMYSDEDTVTMLAKYNLHVGNKYDGSTATLLENPTGVQDETAIGWFSDYSVDNPMIGTKSFSSTGYWLSTTSTYPAYVYNENSYLYEYVENYKSYLEGQGVEINEARLITIEELEGLGCSRTGLSCGGAPSWVYGTSYWSGSADSLTNIWHVNSRSRISYNDYTNNLYGVRPVIVISKDYF